jgi:hypothetical protein
LKFWQRIEKRGRRRKKNWLAISRGLTHWVLGPEIQSLNNHLRFLSSTCSNLEDLLM